MTNEGVRARINIKGVHTKGRGYVHLTVEGKRIDVRSVLWCVINLEWDARASTQAIIS